MSSAPVLAASSWPPPTTPSSHYYPPLNPTCHHFTHHHLTTFHHLTPPATTSHLLSSPIFYLLLPSTIILHYRPHLLSLSTAFCLPPPFLSPPPNYPSLSIIYHQFPPPAPICCPSSPPAPTCPCLLPPANAFCHLPQHISIPVWLRRAALPVGRVRCGSDLVTGPRPRCSSSLPDTSSPSAAASDPSDSTSLCFSTSPLFFPPSFSSLIYYSPFPLLQFPPYLPLHQIFRYLLPPFFISLPSLNFEEFLASSSTSHILSSLP